MKLLNWAGHVLHIRWISGRITTLNKSPLDMFIFNLCGSDLMYLEHLLLLSSVNEKRGTFSSWPYSNGRSSTHVASSCLNNPLYVFIFCAFTLLSFFFFFFFFFFSFSCVWPRRLTYPAADHHVLVAHRPVPLSHDETLFERFSKNCVLFFIYFFSWGFDDNQWSEASLSLLFYFIFFYQLSLLFFWPLLFDWIDWMGLWYPECNWQYLINLEKRLKSFDLWNLTDLLIELGDNGQ